MLFSETVLAAGPDATEGASFTFVRLIVTAMLSSMSVLALPAASLPSRTLTTTLYVFFADSKL